MDDLRAELTRAVDTIVEYREGLPESPVAPVASRASVRQALGELPDDPTRLDQVIDEALGEAGVRTRSDRAHVPARVEGRALRAWGGAARLVLLGE